MSAERLVKSLKEKGLHITTAESCTGGLAASLIVEVSGASDIFEEGYITYSDRVKIRVLGVRGATLRSYSAVSASAAREMAEGAARVSGSQLAISITGYAGPEPGEDGTPAGTVFIGTCYRNMTLAQHFEFQGDRQQVQQQAAQKALELALERLKEV